MTQDGGRGSADRFWFGPVAGLVVLILLGCVYFLISRPHAPSKPASVLVPVTVSEISSLTFTSQGKSLTLYQTTAAGGTSWHIGSPTGAAADSSLTGSFVGALITLTPDRTLTTTAATSADLKSYGLTPPTASVAVNGSGGTTIEQVNVGVASPVGSYYVQIAGKPTIYLVSGMVPAEISANPNAWLPVPSTAGSGTSASAAPPAPGTVAGSTAGAASTASSPAASTASAASSAPASSPSSTTGG